MIVVDFSGVAVAGITAIAMQGKIQPDMGMCRHVILNSLRTLRKRFHNEYGELVLCLDGRHNWRKDVFPYYKAKRKKSREDSKIDWELLYTYLEDMIVELEENFPYKMIRIDEAEADDVIGVLCHEYGHKGPLMTANVEKILIVSNDEDFIQLQKFKNVSQWSPKKRRMLKSKNPKNDLFEKVLSGDSGDGVPNFLSDDDTFVNEMKRQKPLSQKRKDGIMESVAMIDDMSEVMDEIETANFERNRQLIDLSYTPDHIYSATLKAFDEYKPKPRGRLLNYFVKKRLKELTSQIGDF